MIRKVATKRKTKISGNSIAFTIGMDFIKTGEIKKGKEYHIYISKDSKNLILVSEYRKPYLSGTSYHVSIDKKTNIDLKCEYDVFMMDA